MGTLNLGIKYSQALLMLAQMAWFLLRAEVKVLYLLSPLLLLSSCPQEAYCAYTIILMALMWCTESLPLAVTGLFPIVLFPLMGIMDASEVSTPVHRRKGYREGVGGSYLEPWNQGHHFTELWKKTAS